MAELRRRADELAVLNDLARRLAALHDTREVLDEVARQARRLLGVDVAYIMLLRADLLRIEVVDGAMGSAMRGIELGSGQGLGGQVLATGRPLSSERYLEDTRFPHGEGIDAAARSEQLGGILGVPLVVGDDTIGVLLAAERRPRAFGDRDVELLAGLAAHAALALRTADLFDRERAAAAELRSANETLRAVNESRQRASDLRDVLNDVVIRGGGLDAVVAALERSRRPGGGGPRPRRAAPSPGSARPRAGSSSPSTCRADTAATSSRRRRAAGRRGRRGSVAAVADRRHDGGRRSWRRSGRSPRPSCAPAASSSTPCCPPTPTRRACCAGPAPSASTCTPSPPWPSSTPSRWARRPPRSSRPGSPPSCGGWSAAHAGGVVVLLPASVDRTREAVARLAGDGSAPTTGLAAGGGGPHGVRSAHEEARQTAALLLALDRAGSWATSDELGLYRSLFSSSGRAGLATFIDATVGPLLAYDDDHQRDLSVTLETYLEQARHHARTCEVLHIHPNTLYQRLDRVTEVLGPRWKEPDRALELQVALRLHRLLADRSG